MKDKQNKRIKRIKMIKDYRQEVRSLMEKYNMDSFITCLRIHKLNFMMRYAKLQEQKQWTKWFKKMSPEESRKYLDERIPPFFCWHEGKIKDV
jgi:hypothetical protein